MGDQEMLQRMTELKLKMLREKMQNENNAHSMQSQGMQNQYYQSIQAQQMQAQQLAAQQMQAQQMQQMMMLQKQQQLQEAESANRRLRDQLHQVQASQGYRRNDQMGAMERMVEQLSEKLDKPKESESKLDAILAQSLQMQTMMMAQMQSGQGMFGMHPQARAQDAGGHQDPHGQHHGDPSRPHMPGQEHVDPRAEAQNQRDEQLLNDMKAITDNLAKADVEARESAEQAVKAYNENPDHSPMKAGGRNREGGGETRKPGEANAEQEEEEEEEEEEAVADEGDYLLKEEVDAYTDVARSWARKVTKTVVSNVLLEQNFVLEVREPFKGTFFKKGLTQAEVEARILKLGVRLKGLINAIKDSTNTKELPEPLISFMRRLVAHKQKYPEGWLKTGERETLGIPADAHQALEINERQAKNMLAQFIWTRIIVLEQVLYPWKNQIGPQVAPGKQQQGNLKIIAAMVYRGVCAALSPDPTGSPDKQFDSDVLNEIGKLPGDELYLYKEAKELQDWCRDHTREIIDMLFDICFPQGKPGPGEALQIALPGDPNQTIDPNQTTLDQTKLSGAGSARGSAKAGSKPATAASKRSQPADATLVSPGRVGSAVQQGSPKGSPKGAPLRSRPATQAQGGSKQGSRVQTAASKQASPEKPAAGQGSRPGTTKPADSSLDQGADKPSASRVGSAVAGRTQSAAKQSPDKKLAAVPE